MPACLICTAPVEPFLSFGPMPIANGFLTEDRFADEPRFPLEVGHCERCSMVQLTQLVDREQMFHEEYAFFSSTSAWMSRHFADFASWARAAYLDDVPDPFVVELGSNDGIMLRHFAARRVRHLGIEPSANVAAAARAAGVQTMTRFFDAPLAREIVAEHGQASLVAGANVMCHIPYLHSVADGIRLLLAPRGVLVFEDPYLGDIVARTSYDQIYDEHAFYFSLSSVVYLFGEHGLEVVDVVPQEVHGGSMRYVLAHRGTREPSPRVQRLRQAEQHRGLASRKTFETFRYSVERSRHALREEVLGLRQAGKRLVGYGATSKSTTVINYCGLTPDLVEFISDTTPLKQGRFSPGAHIPVRPPSAFHNAYPDVALLFAWNHAGEILEKEQGFLDAGGRFLAYVPSVHTIGRDTPPSPLLAPRAPWVTAEGAIGG